MNNCGLCKKPIYSHDYREFRWINGSLCIVHKLCDFLYPSDKSNPLPHTFKAFDQLKISVKALDD